MTRHPWRAIGLATTMVAALLLAGTIAHATVIVPDLDPPKSIAASFSSDGHGVEVAFDGTRHFVVWQLNGVVHGAFLSADGEILTPGVIEIASSGGWRPSVAYDGTNFLVAWRGPANGGEILAKRVSSTGAVLDSYPIVAANDVKQRRIGLAFDGTRYLAVWRTEADAVRGARIATSGTPLDGPSGFAIGSGNRFYPAVESAGGKFLVVWYAPGNGMDVVGSLVTNGTPAAPFSIANDADDQDHHSVATDGTDYMVAFRDGRYGDSQNLSGTSAVRVTGAGAVLDDPPIKVSDLEWKQGSNPTVAWDGTDWVVAWPEDKPQVKHRVVDTYLRRVSTPARSSMPTRSRSGPATSTSSTPRSPSPATGTWRSSATAGTACSGRSA